MIGVLRALLGAQFVSAQVSRVRHEARLTVTRIALGSVAVLLAVVAVGFFTAAGHATLTRVLGPVSASLIVGGVYLALALIVWLACRIATADRQAPVAAAPELAAADLAAAAQSALHGVGQSVGDAVRNIDPQALATEGGRKLVRTVGPLPLAGIAIVAGYLLARRMDR